jgi:hypothetical protein
VFTFEELDDLVVITYQPGDDDVFESFAHGIGQIASAFRTDFLLDLRGLAGPLDILSNESLGQRWEALARGRDVGRRTAVVSADDAIIAQLDVFRAIYPYRKIAMFPDFETAKDWLAGIGEADSGDIQFI